MSSVVLLAKKIKDPIILWYGSDAIEISFFNASMSALKLEVIDLLYDRMYFIL